MVSAKVHLVDYDNVQQKGEHFFNLFDLEYRQGTSVFDFYNQYRNTFVSSLKKKGDRILWQNRVLTEDEQFSPTFEDLILANLLFLIDTRLPGCVREQYQHIIGKANCLMDYKDEIFAMVPAFLGESDDCLYLKPKGGKDMTERYFFIHIMWIFYSKLLLLK